MSFLNFVRRKAPPEPTEEKLSDYRVVLTGIAYSMLEQFNIEHPCHKHTCEYRCSSDLMMKRVVFIHTSHTGQDMVHILSYIDSPFETLRIQELAIMCAEDHFCWGDK